MKIIYKAKSLSATNYRGRRIKLTNVDTQESITLDWNYEKYFGEQVMSSIMDLHEGAKFDTQFSDGDNNYYIFKSKNQ